MKPKFRDIPRSRNSWRQGRRAGTNRVYVAPLATGTPAAARHPPLTVALHWGTVAALVGPGAVGVALVSVYLSRASVPVSSTSIRAEPSLP